MSKIRYFRLGEEFIISSYKTDSDEKLSVSFSESFNGILAFSDKTYEISGGVCTLPAVNLSDGVHTPRILKDKKSFGAEGFEKHGKMIKTLPLSEDHTRALLEEHTNDTLRIKKLEELYSKLSDKIARTTIF